jgi:hypothetical protein
MPVQQSRTNMSVLDPATNTHRVVVIDVIANGAAFDFSARFTDGAAILARGTDVPGTEASVLALAKQAVLEALGIE